VTAVANPSLRWMAAFAAAAVGCTLVGSFLNAITSGIEPSVPFILTQVLPAVAVTLFPPFALLSFVLMKLDQWTVQGFALGSAVIPMVLFAVLWMVIEAPGPNFVSGFVSWIIAAMIAGVIFHRVWDRLS
jgi:hypothetical protein